MKLLFWLTILLPILLISCSSDKIVKKNGTQEVTADIYFFNYEDPDTLRAVPLQKTGKSKEEIIDTLMKLLSYKVFNTYGDIHTSVTFDLKEIYSIETKLKTYDIAVININDPEKFMRRYYFQGSAGGNATFKLLGTNILQPHNRQRFLDGMIIMINNEPVEESDHINLEGIITPRFIEYDAIQAVSFFKRQK